MMLYVIGRKRKAPQAVGLAPDKDGAADKLRDDFQRATKDALLVHRAIVIPKPFDKLALKIALNHLSGRGVLGSSWIDANEDAAKNAVDRGARAVSSLLNGATSANENEVTSLTPVVRYMMEHVLDTTMRVVGAIAGVSESKVSRWLSGQMEPDMREVQRIIDFARANSLPWKDVWLYNPPTE
jgi:hypothetical protein